MPTRRHFLATAVATATAPALAGQPPAPAPLRVRKNVADLLPNDRVIVAYRAGVKAMKTRPRADKTSWEYWANIHDTDCTHGNWYFFPWHRAYLDAFERVCRAASGDDTFVLPYWDWSVSPRVPAAFWGSDNPLTHPRAVGPNTPLDPGRVGPGVVEDVLETPVAEDFFGGAVSPAQPRRRVRVGSVEFGPHNAVHSILGGGSQFDMGTFVSPRDPIFWLHHANVDRLWTLWEGRGNRTPTAPDFLNGRFLFPSPAGKDSPVFVRDVLTTDGLGYRYDGAGVLVMGRPPRATPAAIGATAAGAFRGPVDSQTPQSVTVIPERRFQEAIPRVVAAGPAGQLPTGYVRLAIEGLRPPADTSVVVRAFLNTPGAAADASIDLPGYVGTINFFAHGGGGAMGHMGMGGEAIDAALNATRAVQRLQAAGLYKAGDAVVITLVATPSAGGQPVAVTPRAAKMEVFD